MTICKTATRAALQQALEALRNPDGLDELNRSIYDLAIAAAEAALDAPQGEPVAWMYEHFDRGLTPLVRSTRWIAAGGEWIESPLYAAPAAPTRAEPEDRYAAIRRIDAELEAMGHTPYTGALNSRYRLLTSAREFLAAAGGNLPQWLLHQAQALRDATERAQEPARAEPTALTHAQAVALLDEWAGACRISFNRHSYTTITNQPVSRDELLQLIHAANHALAQGGAA